MKAVLYAPPSSNLSYINQRAKQVNDVMHSEKAVDRFLLTLQSNQESLLVTRLRPWGQRSELCRDVARRTTDRMDDMLGLSGLAYCPSGSIVSSSGSGQYPLSFDIITSKSAVELEKLGRSIKRQLRVFPGIASVDMQQTVQQDEIAIHLNRDRIHMLGIDAKEVGDTIRTLVRGATVGRFEKDGRSYDVRVRLQDDMRRSLDAVSSVFVRARHRGKGETSMVPLSEIVTFVNIKGPPTIRRSMKGRAYDIKASVKPGYSLVQVYEAFKKDFLDKELPADYGVVPTGELKQYYQDSKDIYLIFGLALVFIFLVMAAQFDSLRDPFVILLSAPLALAGGVLSLGLIENGSLNIYSQIGLITLIGLIVKHGILIVDFANQKKAAGMGVQDAVYEACILRLRPILMTTCAMVLGAVPLMFATGSGFEMRRQIGAVVVWGMVVGTFFTLFAVPLLYNVMSKTKKNDAASGQQ
jgi:multidrug efflux pump